MLGSVGVERVGGDERGAGERRRRRGEFPTKIKDMPIRNGFPHQFTPAVPKGTVADLFLDPSPTFSFEHCLPKKESRSSKIWKSENPKAQVPRKARHLLRSELGKN